MNLLDLIFFAIVAVAVMFGVRLGLLGAIYSVCVVLLGWYASSIFGPLAGQYFEGLQAFGRLITFVSYIFINSVVILLGRKLWPIARTALGLGTLGLSGLIDRGGGLVMGLVLGVALTGFAIVGLLGLVYTVDITDSPLGAAGALRDVLETLLAGSAIMGVFANVADALPGSALGLIPYEFLPALEALQENAG